MSPAIKATTAYGVQFGGCRISAAAKAIAQKMETDIKYRAYLAIFFKLIPPWYTVLSSFYRNQDCVRVTKPGDFTQKAPHLFG